LIARLFKREKRALPADAYWLRFADSAAYLSPVAAEGIAAVYACVQAIAETVGSLPLILYRRGDNGDRVRAPEHPLYDVLHSKPNEWQSALELREMLTAHVLLRGNAFAEIVRGYDGQCRALLPLHPDRVSVIVLESGRLAYDVQTPRGRRRLLQDEVLHLRHRSDDGILGRSPIAVCRDTIRLAGAEREHGIATFANGARISGFLKYPGPLTREQIEELTKLWSERYGGASNAGRTPVLANGMEYAPVAMNLEDAQWVAARQFSVEEVCRLFRVPPTMVGDLRHGNYSNTLELARHFVVHSLRRWLAMWEQAVATQLLSDRGRSIYFAEHSVEGLLRGDAGNRAEFYRRGIEDGWLLRSEVRRLENLPVIEGIDDAERDQDA
jgi:HK97 family phage portal protein